MKYIFYILLLLTTALYANPDSAYTNVDMDLLDKIRVTYYRSIESEESLDTLEQIIANNFGDTISDYPPVILGYYGSYVALKSKHAFWPLAKYNYFNESMEILSKAVDKAPNSLEIRFMRFSVLYYIPAFLGWQEEEKIDAVVIISLLKNADYKFVDFNTQKGIAEFLIKSGHTKQEDISELTNVLLLVKK